MTGRSARGAWLRGAALALLISACGPDEAAVKNAFLKTYPGSEVLEIAPAEGDGRDARYQIRYRMPGDSAVHRVCLDLRDAGGGKWSVAGKQSILEPAPKRFCKPHGAATP